MDLGGERDDKLGMGGNRLSRRVAHKNVVGLSTKISHKKTPAQRPRCRAEVLRPECLLAVLVVVIVAKEEELEPEIAALEEFTILGRNWR